MPECDVCCGFIVVMVLYVLGNTLKVCGPVKGMCWWRCWWIDPHGDEAVWWLLFVVIDEEEISFGSGEWNDAWFLES